VVAWRDGRAEMKPHSGRWMFSQEERGYYLGKFLYHGVVHLCVSFLVGMLRDMDGSESRPCLVEI
jgi:hypothetical protein